MLLEKARKIATEAHKGQFRNDGITPYIKHPEAVYNSLIKIGIKDEDILCAAWLHDTIEDCEFTKEYIEKEFNSNVARIVQTLTDEGDFEKYKSQIYNADYAVKIIKLADCAHNCSSLKYYDPITQVAKAKKQAKKYRNAYLDLAEKLCPKFYDMIKQYTDPWI